MPTPSPTPEFDQPASHGGVENTTVSLLDQRDAAIRERNIADAKVTSINQTLLLQLQSSNVKRHQLPDGSVVSITQPSDREVVQPEVLLTLGVQANTIRLATKVTPVKPFIRVDRPKAPEDDERTAISEAIAAGTH